MCYFYGKQYIMKSIYLDSNASCPPIAKAKEALLKSMQAIGNPSSPHILGRRQRAKLDNARLLVAQALGGHEKNLIFTSGASEANRFLVEAIILRAQKKEQIPNVLISPFEHPSLTKPLNYAAKHGLINLNLLDLNGAKLVLDQNLITCADIIFTSQAHNETGIVVDWSQIIDACSETAVLISDASQGFARLPRLPARVDAIVVSGHKMGAFHGVGALLLRNNAKKLSAGWLGGSQENGLRPGTEALGLIEAFSAVANVIDSQRESYQQISALRDKIEQELSIFWPDVKIIGKHENRLPNTSAIMVPNIDGEDLRIAIDAQKVCVGFGSACSALAPEPSPALLAMNLTPSQIRATIRISLHSETSEKEVLEAINRLNRIFSRKMET